MIVRGQAQRCEVIKAHRQKKLFFSYIRHLINKGRIGEADAWKKAGHQAKKGSSSPEIDRSLTPPSSLVIPPSPLVTPHSPWIASVHPAHPS